MIKSSPSRFISKISNKTLILQSNAPDPSACNLWSSRALVAPALTTNWGKELARSKVRFGRKGIFGRHFGFLGDLCLLKEFYCCYWKFTCVYCVTEGIETYWNSSSYCHPLAKVSAVLLKLVQFFTEKLRIESFENSSFVIESNLWNFHNIFCITSVLFSFYFFPF